MGYFLRGYWIQDYWLEYGLGSIPVASSLLSPGYWQPTYNLKGYWQTGPQPWLKYGAPTSPIGAGGGGYRVPQRPRLSPRFLALIKEYLELKLADDNS